MAEVNLPAGGMVTLSSLVLALRENTALSDVTKAEVIGAALARGVAIENGRISSDDRAAIYFEAMYQRGALERPRDLTETWWACQHGHAFQWGTEDWHADAGQPDGAPAYCQAETENGSCMDSTILVGPYATPEEAVQAALEAKAAWFPPRRGTDPTTGGRHG